jgi:hypothetical protein
MCDGETKPIAFMPSERIVTIWSRAILISSVPPEIFPFPFGWLIS